MLKILFFLAFLTQKLAPSNVLNGIIFAIDEQCNLIFETALSTNCKSYIIFLFSGFPLSFLLFLSNFCFLFHHFSALSLSLCSSSLPPSPRKPKLKHQAKPTFFYFYSVNTLSLSLLYLSLSFLTSFFSLLSLWFADEWVPLMIVLRRLWDADGYGSVAVMKVSSFSFLFFSFFFLRGCSWVQLGSDRARPTQNDMLSNL